MILFIFYVVSISLYFLYVVDFSFLLVMVLLVQLGCVSALLGIGISKWFFCVVMLVFVGGMMIMFFYCLSLSSMIKFDKINWFIMVLLVIPMLGFNTYSFTGNFEYLSGYYELLESSSLILLMIYLLVSLVLTVKISENFKGALQKKF